MPEKITNPFREEPTGLNPDSSEFFKEFVPDYEPDQSPQPDQTKKEQESELTNEQLDLTASPEEKERYENELVAIGEVMIRRSEKEKLEVLVKYVNEKKEDAPDEQDKEKIILGKSVGLSDDGLKASKYFYVNKIGEVVSIDLRWNPIDSLAVFENFQYLEILELGHTNINAVENVKLPFLRHLNLETCLVTRIDPTCFSDRLYFLGLASTPFAEDAQRIANLRQGLPVCDVKVTSY